MNQAQQFYADCGQIVLTSTSIEHTVGQYLTLFLLEGKPTNVFALKDEFAEETFNTKINLIEILCEKKRINEARKTCLLIALHEIKRIRNQVSHWGAAYDPEKDKYHLQDRKPNTTHKDYLDASKAVEEVNTSYFIAYRELAELYNELFGFNTPSTNYENKTDR